MTCRATTQHINRVYKVSYGLYDPPGHLGRALYDFFAQQISLVADYQPRTFQKKFFSKKILKNDEK